MALQDMGEELADHRLDSHATGQEWRVPPRWRIGLIEQSVLTRSSCRMGVCATCLGR